MMDASHALTACLNAGPDAARAGNRACDVAIALNGELAKVGIDRGGRCGCPTGLSYPPDWGKCTISTRPTDETALQPGMTFHFVAGLWMGGWGLETSEAIFITESGPAEGLYIDKRKLFLGGTSA